jgi:hypothetical protein
MKSIKLNNKVLIVIEKIITYIIVVLAITFLTATIIDQIHFVHHPEDYPKIGNYLNGYLEKGILIIIGLTILIVLSIWRLIRLNRILRIVLNSLYLILFIGLSIMYYIWDLNGFEVY